MLVINHHRQLVINTRLAVIIILFIVETVLGIVEVKACNDFQGTNQTDIIDWGANNQTDTNDYHICSIAAGAGGAVGKGIVVFAVVYAVGVIIFDIWTIIVKEWTGNSNLL